jgi:glycosyltransferase involved in cell wall biosynthesis
MKILFISDNYPPYIKGGAEVSTSLLANWLSQHHNTVSVACSTFTDRQWVDNGVTIYPIILRPAATSKNFLSAVLHGFAIIVQQIISAIRVSKLIRNLKPDIVHVVFPSYRFVPIIFWVRIFSKCPSVIDCRDYGLICPAHLSPTYLGNKKDFNEEAQSHHGYRCIGYTSASDPSFLSIRPFALYESFLFNLYKYSLRFLINHFDGIMLVGVSKYVQRQLILNGFEAEKTTVIYNISQSLRKKSPDTKLKIPTFAYGGRIEEDKGIWDLVAAVEVLQQQLKRPFAVKIAGTGGEFDDLQKYIKEHDLNRITLLGHIKPEEVLALYGQSLAIIGPSRIPEPFGRFILDSISVGKPVIATRTGGMPEGIEDGRTGLLVDVGNVEQLATAMRYFIENPERSEAMRDAIIEKQKYYKADFIGKQRLTLYENLLENSV